MYSADPTMNQFFFPSGRITSEEWLKAESSEAIANLRKELLKEARVKWPVVVDLALKKINDILDIKFLDIIEGAWKKYAILLKYTDREKYPPSESYLVSLADHTVKSKHKPAIEVWVDGTRRFDIKFEIELSLTLSGIILKVQDGKIREVHTGTCKGKGIVKCENVVIMEKETQSISLPGSINLGEGIPIAP